MMLSVALAGCGGRSTDDRASDPAPANGWSTLCSRTGRDWLALEEQLPGRWEIPGSYLEVDANLEATHGSTLDGDRPESSGRWYRDARGLAAEQRSCDYSGCIALSLGTAVVGEGKLASHGLWPSDPCRATVTGTYRFYDEHYIDVGGEPRLYSEQSDELTLHTDGTWNVIFRTLTYASISDLGVVRWEGGDLPSDRGGTDRGRWTATDVEVRLTRAEPEVWPQWFGSDPPGEPRALARIGPALAGIAIAVYERR